MRRGMKAITIYQPFAFAIVAGLKKYETRPRRTNIRGRIAVHASIKDPWKTGILKDMDEMRAIARILSEYRAAHGGPRIPPQLEFGVIMGTVEITDCKPVEQVIETLTAQERILGDYTPGRYAWILKNPVLFSRPIPAHGKQGWWNWDERGIDDEN